MKGLGVDIVDIRKLKKILSGKAGARFKENTFTEKESAYAGRNASKLATAFAAKEALFKALKTGWIEGKEAELLRDADGVPEIKLHGETKRIAKKKGIRRIDVSVSYAGDAAIAAVICS